MKNIFTSFYILLLAALSGTILSSYSDERESVLPPYHFPYKQAGLTERQAAAHLISRFSFGVTPAAVDEVTRMGIEKWFEAQLAGTLPDEAVEPRLAGYTSLAMTNKQIAEIYPKGGQVMKMAIRDGDIVGDSVNKGDKKSYRKEIKQYMQERGLKPQADLLRELVSQKIIRAAYSNNQLKEVMADFWFNHFNVAVAKGRVQQFVTSYERDVIRPNVLGKFESLLLATAQSPAMLTFLDNDKSSASEENRPEKQKKTGRKRIKVNTTDSSSQGNTSAKIRKPKLQGLNENYAREIMELHTLGVDAGYTQADVTGAARVLTGWSIHPALDYNATAKKHADRKRLGDPGAMNTGSFLFAANKHDKEEKTVLGHHFPSGGGYEEGLKLIHLLAVNPSTAKFISRKLAIRFVNDDPPRTLTDKMAKIFLERDGNIKDLLLTMVAAPEFWSKAAVREKTKSPFELAVSAIRSTNTQIDDPLQLYQWINKMGQKLYNYQAPTGFPDNGQYWINSGSLLNRMNFGLALAAGRIPGTRPNLLALNNNHEPESALSALKLFSRLLLPERDVAETIKRLTPLLNDPDLGKKLDQAAGQTETSRAAAREEDQELMQPDEQQSKTRGKLSLKKSEKNGGTRIQFAKGDDSMLGQVAGIIIGSPEFQRR